MPNLDPDLDPGPPDPCPDPVAGPAPDREPVPELRDRTERTKAATRRLRCAVPIADSGARRWTSTVMLRRSFCDWWSARTNDSSTRAAGCTLEASWDMRANNDATTPCTTASPSRLGARGESGADGGIAADNDSAPAPAADRARRRRRMSSNVSLETTASPPEKAAELQTRCRPSRSAWPMEWPWRWCPSRTASSQAAPREEQGDEHGEEVLSFAKLLVEADAAVCGEPLGERKAAMRRSDGEAPWCEVMVS